MSTTTLSHYVSFYVPSTVQADTRAGAAEVAARVSEISTLFASYYGGYTTIDAAGGYMATTGQKIEEPVVQVKSFTDAETLERTRPAIFRLAEQVCAQWSQESIGVEIDGVFNMIDLSI